LGAQAPDDREDLRSVHPLQSRKPYDYAAIYRSAAAVAHVVA
jgi:hypothetical protein